MNLKMTNFNLVKFSKNPNIYPELKCLLGLILVAVILSASSCSVKKDEIKKHESNVFSVPQMAKDSDNDGIPDAVELARGSNPFMADIPRISIQKVNEISFGASLLANEQKSNSSRVELKQIFKDIGQAKAGDLDFKSSLRKKIISNQLGHVKNINVPKEDVIVEEDLRTNILSKWEDINYYSVKDFLNDKDQGVSNRSGKFLARFKIKISDSKNVTDLNNILLKSFYFNFKSMDQEEIFDHYLQRPNGTKENFGTFELDTFEPVTEYSLLVDGLESSAVFKNLLDRKEIGLKFFDYNYTSSGLKLSYTEVMSRVVSNNAKIVISNGKLTEVYYVTPGMNMLQTLDMLKKDYTLDKNGDFYKIGDFENKINLPFDLEKFQSSNLNDGIWSYYGDAENPNDLLKPQGLYVLAYSTVKDFINVMKLDQSEQISIQNANEIILDNIYADDELLLNFELKNSDVYSEVYSQRKYENGESPSCKSNNIDEEDEKRGGDYCKPTVCTQVVSSITKTTTSEAANFDQIYNQIKISDDLGNDIFFNKYKYGKNMKIIFPNKLNLLRNRIHIILSKPKEVVLREGIISDSCTNQPAFKNVKLNENSLFNLKYDLFSIQN